MSGLPVDHAISLTPMRILTPKGVRLGIPGSLEYSCGPGVLFVPMLCFAVDRRTQDAPLVRVLFCVVSLFFTCAFCSQFWELGIYMWHLREFVIFSLQRVCSSFFFFGGPAWRKRGHLGQSGSCARRCGL